MEFNIYCDESCHLEHDGINIMTIGAVYCPKEKVIEINKRIKEIKEKHGVKSTSEIKWTKVSNIKEKLYLDILDYFFDDDDIHFRCLIADKTILNHDKYRQTHDDWYYKMYFDMLKAIFEPSNSYNVYIDIKDTNSYKNVSLLHNYSCNNKYDFSHSIIRKMQPIRSNEVQIMQITDLLIGAVAFENRIFKNDHHYNPSKIKIVNRIKERSGYTLKKKTLYRENKFNLFFWGKY